MKWPSCHMSWFWIHVIISGGVLPPLFVVFLSFQKKMWKFKTWGSFNRVLLFCPRSPAFVFPTVILCPPPTIGCGRVSAETVEAQGRCTPRSYWTTKIQSACSTGAEALCHIIKHTESPTLPSALLFSSLASSSSSSLCWVKPTPDYLWCAQMWNGRGATRRAF